MPANVKARGGVVDNSSKSAKGEGRKVVRGGASDRSIVQTAVPYNTAASGPVSPSSVATTIMNRSQALDRSASSLIDVLARLGVIQHNPSLAEDAASSENALSTMDNYLRPTANNTCRRLYESIHGPEMGEDDDCDDRDEEEKGDISKTTYGNDFYRMAGSITETLRAIRRHTDRLRVSLLGASPMAEAKEPAQDPSRSLVECVNVLCGDVDRTAAELNALASDIAINLLGDSL